MFFGWLPDIPDIRDYTIRHPDIAPLLAKKAPLSPSHVDLRPFCPPAFDQGRLGSCTANAAAGLVGYYQNRLASASPQNRLPTAGPGSLNPQSPSLPVSRLFTYKTTRNLMETDGDTGAYIRTTMGSLALFGVPPEKFWEYDVSRFDEEPPAFCYSFASNFQALKYFRLDAEGLSNAQILTDAKSALSCRLPLMFGFTAYESIGKSPGGVIPFPKPKEKALGGHAVCAVGYDDSLKIGSCSGAFIIRNSWGENWGEKGYGYLPYEYLLQGIALDWWCLLKAEWIDLKQFGI